MTRRLAAAALLFTTSSLGCANEDRALPEDVYEDGWDETTRSQRVQLLRRDLEHHLDALRTAQPGSDKHRAALENSSHILSALRPELTANERGRDEYRELETQLEALTGDAR